jgi:hypothetical protein
MDYDQDFIEDQDYLEDDYNDSRVSDEYQDY